MKLQGSISLQTIIMEGTNLITSHTIACNTSQKLPTMTNYYDVYFIIETHSVLCILLSNDKLYIYSGG